MIARPPRITSWRHSTACRTSALTRPSRDLTRPAQSTQASSRMGHTARYHGHEGISRPTRARHVPPAGFRIEQILRRVGSEPSRHLAFIACIGSEVEEISRSKQQGLVVARGPVEAGRVRHRKPVICTVPKHKRRLRGAPERVLRRLRCRARTKRQSSRFSETQTLMAPSRPRLPVL
jgi:hypothetical protein